MACFVCCVYLKLDNEVGGEVDSLVSMLVPDVKFSLWNKLVILRDATRSSSKDQKEAAWFSHLLLCVSGGEDQLLLLWV
jgi:hypothetical protein